jgi:alpha-tubulin suppressor-like RCC1 family protein
LEAGVTAVSAGQNHTCAAVNNELKCWGSNSAGQLGINLDAVTNYITEPTSLSTALKDISAIAAGENHTCAVSEKQLYCWGDNYYGQLGAPPGTTFVPPTKVADFNTPVTAVATHKSHTCAIAEGALWCFGSNLCGQLGTGATGTCPPFYSTTTPIPPVSSIGNPVPGMDSGTTAVSVGNQHTCAIKDSQLFCWGSNSNGQLGFDKTKTQTESPQLVPGMEKGVTAVAAGDEHTCAIKESALYCWGRSDRGQVGNGTAGTMSHAIDKPTLIFASGVTAVSAGAGTCAVLYGRELKCWGMKFSGIPQQHTTTTTTGVK